MSALSNQAYREAFERFLARLGWTVERSNERRAIWTNKSHFVFVPRGDGSDFDMFMDRATATVREATGATFVYEVADLFPRWQIRRKGDEPAWDTISIDAGEGLEPDWSWVGITRANPDDYIAVQVSAIQTRQHPNTQGAQP